MENGVTMCIGPKKSTFYGSKFGNFIIPFNWYLGFMIPFNELAL
jgi:hypothetical protein